MAQVQLNLDMEIVHELFSKDGRDGSQWCIYPQSKEHNGGALRHQRIKINGIITVQKP